jgi:hypothetical protein
MCASWWIIWRIPQFCDAAMTLFAPRVTLLASHVTLHVTVHVTLGD